MLVSLAAAVAHISDATYAQHMDANGTVIVFYTPLCDYCEGVDKIAYQVADAGYNTCLLDCAANRLACAVFKKRKAPGAAYVQNGVRHVYEGRLTGFELQYWLVGLTSDLKVLTRDYMYDYVEQNALDIYIQVEVATRDFLQHFEKWRDDGAVLFVEAKHNGVVAHRQGIEIRATEDDLGFLQSFVERNRQPLLQTTTYTVFRDSKMHAVIFTSEDVVIEEALSYMRRLYLDKDQLLDQFDFYISHVADGERQISYADFPFVLVLRPDTRYYLQEYKSTYHFNRFLNDILLQREDPIEDDPDNYLTPQNNFNVQFIDANDERNYEDDEDYDYE